MSSVDIFNIAALEVMHKCLSTFPVPAQINPNEISETVNEYFETAECNPDICLHTVKWLLAEEFLMEGGSNLSFFRLTLSQKGLNAVNSYPTAINEKRSIRSFIEDGLSKISMSTASGIMVDLFKNGS